MSRFDKNLKFKTRILPLVLIGLPLLFSPVYIWLFGVNVPYWDEWSFVPFLRNPIDANWVAAVWQQQSSDHHLVLTRLLLYPLANLTGWNLVAEMYLNLLWPALSLLGLWLIYRRVGRAPLWGFVPVAWVVFNLGQGESFLWGWMISHFLVECGAIWFVYLLTRGSSRLKMLAAFVGFIPPLAVSEGLFIAPVGVLYAVLAKWDKRWVIGWAFGGVILWIIYFIGYVTPAVYGSPLALFSHPLAPLSFFLANVGAPLGARQMYLSTGMGAVVCVIFGLFVWWWFKRIRAGGQLSSAELAWGSLALFSFLASTAITIGRTEVAFGMSILSRYTTVTGLAVIAVYLLCLNDYLERDPLVGRAQVGLRITMLGLLILMLGGLMVSYAQGIAYGRFVRINRLAMSYALQNFENQPDDALQQLFPRPSVIREYAAFLSRRKLSTFAEPNADALLWTSPNEGLSDTLTVRDGATAEHFVCPLQTLKDLEIRFAASDQTSPIQLSLSNDPTPYLETTIDTQQLNSEGWAWVSLPRPISECKGKQLTLRLESQSNDANLNWSVFLYSRYYEGTLLTQNSIVPSGYVMALELNAYSYGTYGTRLELSQQIQAFLQGR